MDTLSLSSYQAYRKLVYDTPELLIYWQQATPINEINQMRIGSRPARRGGGMQVSNLRAIPWVFSWMQSRHVLPGWYGLGTALQNYITDPEQLTQLQDMYKNWSFFKNVINNAQLSIGKADMGIARLYSELVEDTQIRQMIFNDIHAEYERTVESILRITDQREILENDPVLRRSIKLRNPYVDPLNFMQVSLLRQLRALPDPFAPAAEPILQTIFLTINGVAAGLKNTG
jgi:phosphoenolpyruvate carboxylase